MRSLSHEPLKSWKQVLLIREQQGEDDDGRPRCWRWWWCSRLNLLLEDLGTLGFREWNSRTLMDGCSRHYEAYGMVFSIVNWWRIVLWSPSIYRRTWNSSFDPSPSKLNHWMAEIALSSHQEIILLLLPWLSLGSSHKFLILIPW